MAVTTTIVGRRKYDNGFDLIVNLDITGTYPGAPGEPLDVSLLAGLSNRQPKYVSITCGTSAVMYTYDKNNKTIRVWCNSAGGANGVFTEHTNAAYVANVDSDTQIELVATFLSQ